MKKILGLLFVASTLLYGCSNGFTQYYAGQNLQQVKQAKHLSTSTKPTAHPLPKKPPEEIIQDMFIQGYELIGTASWVGDKGEAGEKEVLNQAKKVGASKVLWTSYYSHTTKFFAAVIDEDAPQPKPGEPRPTKMVEQIRDRYRHKASFFAQLKNDPHRLMVLTVIPSTSYTKVTNSRPGALVTAVMKDGTAYKAGVLANDIIMAINGHPLKEETELASVLRYGASNTLSIFRDGKAIEIIVTLPAE